MVRASGWPLVALGVTVVVGLGGLEIPSATAQQNEPVVVRPVEIRDVLTNPGMGIVTFQRFDGQAINPGLTWSEVGPVTRLEDATTPVDFPVQ